MPMQVHLGTFRYKDKCLKRQFALGIATAATEIAAAATEDVRNDTCVKRNFAVGLKTRAAVGFNIHKHTNVLIEI
jgi:hypothetical protein